MNKPRSVVVLLLMAYRRFAVFSVTSRARSAFCDCVLCTLGVTLRGTAAGGDGAQVQLHRHHHGGGTGQRTLPPAVRESS